MAELLFKMYSMAVGRQGQSIGLGLKLNLGRMAAAQGPRASHRGYVKKLASFREW